MQSIVEQMGQLLPPDKPRYLMGVGTPADIVNAIEQGIDMFDCVLPTRNARNGTVFTRFGKLTVKAAVYSQDFRPVDEECDCLCCRRYSRAYLRHLLNVGEIAASRLLTWHNLHFYLTIMRSARAAIFAGRFAEFRSRFFAFYNDEGNVV